MGASQPKFQHYLPVCYLDGFSRDGMLHIFDRERCKYRKQSAQKVAAENHFYTITKEDGEKDFTIEKWLGAKVEPHFKPILHKLERRQTLTMEEKSQFALFIALLKVRTPEFARNYTHSTAETVKASIVMLLGMPEFEKRLMKDAPESIKTHIKPGELRKFAEEHFKVTIDSNERLRMMIKLALMHHNHFRQLEWTVNHCPPETSYITTDAPLVILPPPGWIAPFGTMTPGAIKVVPLSQTMCLAMTERGDAIKHRRVSKMQARNTNRLITSECEGLVIGRDERHVRNLVENTGVDEERAPLRVKVG